jgi:hypothetical protein
VARRLPARRHERPAELDVAGDLHPAQVGEDRRGRLLDAHAGRPLEQVGDRHAVAQAVLVAPDRHAGAVEQHSPVRPARGIVGDRHRRGS